jgi:UDP-glucuronate 4-epimerase
MAMMAGPWRILVTGAAGFIGMQSALRFLDAGHSVLGIDNLNAYYDPALKAARLGRLSGQPRFRFEAIDITDQPAIDGAFEQFRPDIVLHCAAQAGVRYSLEAPHSYTRANVDGFLSLLEAARQHPVQHFLYASSSSVYGRNAKVPFAENDPVNEPASLYAATKRANELMAATYAHLFRIPLTGLRFFTVYGPWGRPDMAPWLFTASILRGEPIQVFDEAMMSRDFTYIDDVTAAIEALLPLAPNSESAPHRLVNIGHHHPEKLSDFISVIEKACGRPAIRVPRPRPPGDVPATYADISLLVALTGIRPSIPITKGIPEFVSWYRNYAGR